VHCAEWTIQVIDDGCGISKEDLSQVGSRHATSKITCVADLVTPTFLGYRGEALASIVDVARHVEIVSTRSVVKYAVAKTWSNGNVTMESQTAVPKDLPAATGTKVTVTDIFGRMPVRQIYSNELSELENVRQVVQRLALVHANIGFTLYDVTRGANVLQTNSLNGLLSRFSSIFGSSKATSLVEHVLEPSAPEISISGLLSLPNRVGLTRKDYQFVYCNRRPVASKLVQKALNQIYAPFMREASKRASVNHREGLKLREQVSTFYPAFLVNITCSHMIYDVISIDGQTAVEFTDWPTVLESIHRWCVSFVEPMGYKVPSFVSDPKMKPPRRKQQIDAAAVLEQRPSQSDLVSVYTVGPSWSEVNRRMNESKEELRLQEERRNTARQMPIQSQTEQNAIRGITVKRKSRGQRPILKEDEDSSALFSVDTIPMSCECCKRQKCDIESHEPQNMLGGAYANENENVEPVRSMLDRASRQQKLEWKQIRSNLSMTSTAPNADVKLNTQNLPTSTNLSAIASILDPSLISKGLPPSSLEGIPDDDALCLAALADFEKRQGIEPPSTVSLVTNPLETNVATDGRKSIKSMLTEWTNPVFKAGARVLTLQKDGPEHTIKKDSLKTLSVLGQLDTKYILCRSEDSGMVVAIDQHAADERVRLEELEKEVLAQHKNCSISNVVVNPPRLVELDPSERDLIEQHHTQLSNWGWNIEVLTKADALSDPNEMKPCHSALLLSVPVVRCVALGVPEFLEHLHQLKGTLGATIRPPPGITRVLNSVACRGAIMFGDALEHEQCGVLLQGLSTCKHPFQCAHGRPSMAPLVDMKDVYDHVSKHPKFWQSKPKYANIRKSLDTAPLF